MSRWGDLIPHDDGAAEQGRCLCGCCDQDDSHGVPRPPLGVLRTASTDLMVGELGGSVSAAMTTAVKEAADVERWYTSCAALGADRATANRLLRDMQGLQAGSTSTAAEHADVLRRLAQGEMTVTADLLAFLRARLDEDEQAARAACWDERSDVWTARPPRASYERYTVVDYLDDGVVVVTPENADADGVGQHIAEHDPARVLREVEAKRRTLTRCEEALLSANPMLVHFAQQTLRDMAQPYTGRAGT